MYVCMYAVSSDSSTAGLPREFLVAQMSPEHMDEVNNQGLKKSRLPRLTNPTIFLLLRTSNFLPGLSRINKKHLFRFKRTKSSHRRLKTFRKYLTTLCGIKEAIMRKR